MQIYDSPLTRSVGHWLGASAGSPGERPAPSGQCSLPRFGILAHSMFVSGRRMGFHGKVINSSGTLPCTIWPERVSGENHAEVSTMPKQFGGLRGKNHRYNNQNN